MAIGSREFIDHARSWVQSVSPEQANRVFLARCIPFERIVFVVESVKGESFDPFRDRHGDWGLALILYLARRHSGLTLSEIGTQAGGLAYKAVFAQIKRLRRKLDENESLRAIVEQCMQKMLIVET